MAKYQSTKRYTHAEGLSCAFRQWRANSHCNLIHGYALEIFLGFEAYDLDERNWVVDFGGIKELKKWLHDTFDHTTCVAEDDPHLDEFKKLHDLKVLDLRVLPSVGCEKFAELVFNKASEIIREKYGARCQVIFAEVREHAGNSAIYRPS